MRSFIIIEQFQINVSSDFIHFSVAYHRMFYLFFLFMLKGIFHIFFPFLCCLYTYSRFNSSSLQSLYLNKICVSVMKREVEEYLTEVSDRNGQIKKLGIMGLPCRTRKISRKISCKGAIKRTRSIVAAYQQGTYAAFLDSTTYSFFSAFHPSESDAFHFISCFEFFGPTLFLWLRCHLTIHFTKSFFIFIKSISLHFSTIIN